MDGSISWMKSKIVVAAIFLIFAVLLAVLFVQPEGDRYYIATSAVVLMPLPAGVLTNSSLIIPGIHVKQVNTAGVIQLAAFGTTPESAQTRANDAASSYCTKARQIYGGKASIIQMATPARRYSIFHDPPIPEAVR